ncbi:hypothetical protein ABDD95_15580 [Mucilaginibacter sp. PAMB04274]|uniref:hypothetical protein n=1 Tax=Mucilaginibacter sp. PAMB04274 TaxID=3138568 RepID=UPI0031F6A927
MKKTLFLTLFVLIKLSAFCQLTADPKIYVGKTIFVKPFDREYTTYLLKNVKGPIDGKNLLYPKPSEDKSEHDSIVTKSFECQDGGIYNKQFNYLKLYSSATGAFFFLYNNQSRPLFLITAEEKKAEEEAELAKKAALYARLQKGAEVYKANLEKEREEDIKALNEAVKKDNETLCANINEDYDEFEKYKTFSTSTAPPQYQVQQAIKQHTYIPDRYNTQIFKIIQKGIATYTLDIDVITTTALATRKGVFIILANGKRINKPNEEVQTDVRNGDFRRSTSIILSPADMLLLKASPIKKFKLYDVSGEVDAPERLYKQFICLLSKK